MGESEITKALDDLWLDAQAIMKELGDEFTYRQFLRKLMDYRKHDYIRLLQANFHREDPFDAAQQLIGKRLKKMALAAGYQRFEERGTDLSIFDKPTDKIIYRRN